MARMSDWALCCALLSALSCAPPREVGRAAPPAENAAARVATAVPSGSAPIDMHADAPTASASEWPDAPSPSATPGVEPLPAVDAKRCILPAVRPPDLSIRFLRVVLPIHADLRREAVELHAELACPAAGGPRAALERLPCKRLTPEQLTQVYTELRSAGFSSLESDTSGVARSPHYGTRTIEIVFGAQRCIFTDSSTRPVAPGSEKAFFRMIDAITSR
ncbi:MAG: hypothetical protein JNL21_41990 [Myxococcales bacterium]|nr:hypothetical protein [Myxococcales bacterium]